MGRRLGWARSEGAGGSGSTGQSQCRAGHVCGKGQEGLMRLRESRQHNGNAQQNQDQYRSLRYLHIAPPDLRFAPSHSERPTSCRHDCTTSLTNPPFWLYLLPLPPCGGDAPIPKGEVSKYDNPTSIHCRTMHSCLPLPGNARRLAPLTTHKAHSFPHQP